MAAGDWGAGCVLRPSVIQLEFDANNPVDITGIAISYSVIQPSTHTVPELWTWTPAQPVPIANGLNAINTALLALLAYEGLGVG